MTLDEMIDRAVHERAPALEQVYTSLPLDVDLSTERQRHTVAGVRRVAAHRRGDLLNAVNQVNRLRPRVEENEQWRDVLLAFVTWADGELAELEKTPPASRSDAHYRRMDALRDGQKQAQRGVEWMGAMCMIAEPLTVFLRARGYAGNPFSGRGSLRTTEERLEVFRRNLAEVEKRIELELATPLPTLELPAAQSL